MVRTMAAFKTHLYAFDLILLGTQGACLSDDVGTSSSDTTVVDVNPGLNETCSAWEPTRSANSIELEPIAAGGWERSVFALQTERFPSRWYIAEQRGVVSFYDEITGERQRFLMASRWCSHTRTLVAITRKNKGS